MNRVFAILVVFAAAAPAVVAQPMAPPAPAGPGLSSNGGSVSVDIIPAPAAAAPSPELFTPDVYPSHSDAATGLAELWVNRGAEQWAREPERVRVYCCDPVLYAAVATGIRSRLPQARVEKASSQDCPDGFDRDTPGVGEAWVRVDDAAPQPPERGHKTVAAGELSVASKGASDAAVTARYVDKPWLSNFAAFSHGQPRRWVVGRSDPLRPAMSEAEAARGARAAAAKGLFDLVRPRLARADDGWLTRRLEDQLAGGQYIVDQFPQKFERRFGTTWREAVLVDASPQNINDLSQQLFQEHRSQRRGGIFSVVSAGGVLLVTYAAYRLANSFTRGYFVWSLRTTAAVVATAAVVVVRMVVG